jgi:hypothetical protein
LVRVSPLLPLAPLFALAVIIHFLILSGSSARVRALSEERQQVHPVVAGESESKSGDVECDRAGFVTISAGEMSVARLNEPLQQVQSIGQSREILDREEFVVEGSFKESEESEHGGEEIRVGEVAWLSSSGNSSSSRYSHGGSIMNSQRNPVNEWSSSSSDGSDRSSVGSSENILSSH